MRALHPRYWWAHGLALLAVGLAVALGLWQWQAWQSARAAAAQDLTNAAPIPLARAMGPDDPFLGTNLGRPVTLSGTWRNASTVYVQRGSAYWVLTPLAIGPPEKAATDPAIYVVRGQVTSRDHAPALPSGQASITGWLQPPEGTGETDPDPTDNVLPQVRLADLVQHVDQDLWSGYVIQRGGLSPGLAQAEPEALPGVGEFTGARNLFYAIEWWFFGAFAVFLWWRFLREEVYAEGSGATSNLTA